MQDSKDWTPVEQTLARALREQTGRAAPPCPEPETWLALAEGSAVEGEPALRLHLAQCGACRELYAGMLETFALMESSEKLSTQAVAAPIAEPTAVSVAPEREAISLRERMLAFLRPKRLQFASAMAALILLSFGGWIVWKQDSNVRALRGEIAHSREAGRQAETLRVEIARLNTRLQEQMAEAQQAQKRLTLSVEAKARLNQANLRLRGEIVRLEADLRRVQEQSKPSPTEDSVPLAKPPQQIAALITSETARSGAPGEPMVVLLSPKGTAILTERPTKARHTTM
jgi:hypothetical protein